LHTSGKFDNDSYVFSTGSLGVGQKVVVALSSNFRAISVRPNRVGSILVQGGKPPEDITSIKRKNPTTGTYVIFELDPEFFDKIDEFSKDGYEKISDLFKLFNLFSNYNISISIQHDGIVPEFWTSEIPVAMDLLAKYVETAQVTFDNTIHFTQVDDYVKSYFNINRPWSWQHKLELPLAEKAELGYTILLYAVKYESIGGCLSLVNNVPMVDLSSSHIVQCQMAIKKVLSDHIQDQNKKKYVIDQYKLPIFMCIDIKYFDAEFIGTHKTGFKDSNFSRLYGKSLLDKLNTSTNKAIYKELYELLEQDIENKYSLFTTGATLIKNDNRLILELAYPRKFSNCSTTDRSEAELFITEGSSAGSNEGRDSRTQATYQLRGKPLNPITTQEKLNESSIKVQRFDIFQDILKITGLTPNMTDFSQLKYGKIFIMVDADSHGKHIASIIIGSLYAINPKFVESGILHIITPPLYVLKLKHIKNRAKTLFIRSSDELIDVLSANLYYNVLEVGIVSPGVFDKPRILELQEFVEFSRIVAYIGDTLTRLSNEHIVNPIILEQLTHVSYYLTPETMDVNVLKDTLQYDDISYDRHNNMLTISIGRQDIVLSLYAINTSLYREILPFLNKICWKKLGIVLTSKLSDLYKSTPVSFVQLYQIYKSLEELFEIRRLKGLGSMTPTDRAQTCMSVKHRSAIRITSIGDIPTIFNMLGSDADHRKELLQYK
jgi:DNA gyrase/topoisomerase IV subunit B